MGRGTREAEGGSGYLFIPFEMLSSKIQLGSFDQRAEMDRERAASLQEDGDVSISELRGDANADWNFTAV